MSCASCGPPFVFFSFSSLLSVPPAASVGAVAAAFSSFTGADLRNRLRVLGNVTNTSSNTALLGDPTGQGASWGGVVWRQSLPFTSYGNSLCVPSSWASAFSFSVSDADTGGLLFFVTRDQFGRLQATDVDGGVSGMRVPDRSSVSVEFDNLLNTEDGDVNGNHIGINVGPTLSSTVNSGVDPSCAPPLTGTVYAWVEYSADDLALYVYASADGTKPSAPSAVLGGFNTCFGSAAASAYAVGFLAGSGSGAPLGSYELLAWTLTFGGK